MVSQSEVDAAFPYGAVVDFGTDAPAVRVARIVIDPENGEAIMPWEEPYQGRCLRWRDPVLLPDSGKSSLTFSGQLEYGYPDRRKRVRIGALRESATKAKPLHYDREQATAFALAWPKDDLA